MSQRLAIGLGVVILIVAAFLVGSKFGPHTSFNSNPVGFHADSKGTGKVVLQGNVDLSKCYSRTGCTLTVDFSTDKDTNGPQVLNCQGTQNCAYFASTKMNVSDTPGSNTATHQVTGRVQVTP